MLKSISRAQLIGGWFLAVAVLTACAVVIGVSVTLGTGTLLLATCLVPPAIILLVWQGAPPVTVAELLHAVETPNEGR
jgi:hypothetical protein